MGDAPQPQRKQFKGKRRRKNINTNLMEVVSQLAPHNLQGLLLGRTVWVCCAAASVSKLDVLCLGNLDGGEGTAARVRDTLAAGGVAVEEAATKAVRLSLEEAFFMAYVLRVLRVHAEPAPGQAPVPLGEEALWQRLQRARPDFLILYLAYHHFRSKGWIPRTGLQYGADMVLYQRHPSLAHADYSVHIMPRGASADWRPPASWHDIQILNRLTAQVSKKLLLLYVQEGGPGCGGGGASEEQAATGRGGSGDYSSPKCLARFLVQERIVRRWVPDSHRPA